MFYLFLNIRRTKFCITRLSASSRSCQRSKRSCRVSTRSCRLSTCSCRLSTPSCRLSTPSCRLSTPSCTTSCRLPVLSDLLLWSGAFSTHCTDANRRETMPKQHYITCLAQCVPTLHPPSGFVSTPPSFYCRTLVGSLPLANNGQHSASYY